MTGRPEILFPLFSGLETLPDVGPKLAQGLARMGITAPRDLLFHLPHSGVDRQLRDTMLGLALPATVTVQQVIISHNPPQNRSAPYRVLTEGPAGRIELIFFRPHKDYIQRMLPIGATRLLSGRVEDRGGQLQMAHPEHILSPDDCDALPSFEPVYPLTHGVTQRVMAKSAQAALDRAPALDEWIDPALLAKQDWPNWRTALQGAHHPRAVSDLADDTPARQRLAYDELFAHQLTLCLARAAYRQKPGRVTDGDGQLRDKVLANLPYAPTGAQTRAVAEIAADMASPNRMSRLLQGDVGAGKTLVAFMALCIAIEAGGQGALMAPTEILARQHMETLQPLAETVGLRLALLTGRDKGRQRLDKLQALASGQIDILIGTHSLFQEDVVFADLRLAIVDEQHRFGVRQRLGLGAKGQQADVLVMTATPIPRSLALAQYGDMDVSILDEKPPGRQPIKTVMISDARLDEVTENLRRAIDTGAQAYWVCPLVEESEVLTATAAQDRFTHLRAALGDQVGLVHGQMKPAEKDAVMAEFVAGRLKVLVATTVIEVGVNVPNATIMVIESAERFGLAQLHQLRGRVGRGDKPSSCLLLYTSPLGQTAARRLGALRDTEDGFAIAEMDLALRGAGDLIGTAQSGLPRFQIADLERQSDLLALAQSDARALLVKDPDLTTQRGRAARCLLWLMRKDEAIRYLSVG